MIFKQAQQVVDGRKRQTRRPVKPGEHAIFSIGTDKILSVIGANGRLKWQVGKDYAAQPGRGVKAIGRTPPIEAIRRERLHEISPEDAFAEMATPKEKHTPRGVAIALIDFMRLWDSLYRKSYRWRDNPEVWALQFELVEDFTEFIMRETEAAIEGGIIDPNTGVPFEPEEGG